jgi:hypothetical protein
MKKIIVLFALLLGSIISIAQPVTQRGTSAVTVQDSRLFAEFNFRPPAFPDTVRANQQIGLDSCGALIFSRDINAYYYRACSPKRWVRVASGGSTSDSAYLSYRPLTDTTFLLCRVGGTRCDTIKVNGQGATQAWLLGGNLNPKSNNLGTTSTTDVIIITNDVARMKIAGNGINRSAAARNRYLMIDTSSRYLYYGDEADTTAWKLLGNSNAIAGTNFVGTTNNVPLEFRIKNKKSGIIDSTNKNVGLGFNTLKTNAPNGVILPPPNNATLGTYNVAIGHNALSKDTLGYQNVAIGGGALGTTTTYSQRNVAVGYATLNQSRTPSYDVALGWGALPRDYYGSANVAIGADVANFFAPNVGDTMRYNTMVGYASGYYKYDGRNNVFVGDSTGAYDSTGSRNVFIGSKAGRFETGSDKLYIANSSTSNPLVKGNFGDSTLNVNGKMSISLTSQTPDSSLDVTGGVKLRTIYESLNLTDSMLVLKSDGGIGKREIVYGNNNNNTTSATRIISGSAVWDSLLIYSVTSCFYYINGNLYNSAATNVTLAAADSSNPRIDVIYCDTLGHVGVITGIPSPNPVKPTVNPLSQIELTHININAQAKTPVGVGNRIIYNENVGIPNEWNTSVDVPLSGVNFAYPTNPYVGTKSALAPLYELPYNMIFTNNAFLNADTTSELSMYLRLNSAPPVTSIKNANGTVTEAPLFNIYLVKSGVKVTSTIGVVNNNYGYNRLLLSTYQHIAIPLSDFVFLNSADKTFDRLVISIAVKSMPALGTQFDYITAGAGGTPPAVTSNYWSLSGNDNTSFPSAKLGTTSNDQLSITTNNIERINIANTGVISIPQLQTTTDTLLYKPLVINPTNGQVAGITNWGNNTVYTENPIMSRTSGDSNIIYFNPDTANVWRGGGSGTIPTLQQVLDNNHELVNGINLQGTSSGESLQPYNLGNINSLGNYATYYSYGDDINAMGYNAAREMYSGVNSINAFGNNAGYYYGSNGGATYESVNLFGNNAGAYAYGSAINAMGNAAASNNSGNDINAMGSNAATSNSGFNVNAMGSNAASGNIGNNVNSFGAGAGLSNIYSDVNLFGQGATATNSNQIVFSKNGGNWLTRINQSGGGDVTYNLPNNGGTFAVSVNNQPVDANGNVNISGGLGTVTDISQGYGITASPTNPITVSGTIEVDTVTLSGKYLRINDTTNMLSKYVPFNGSIQAVNLGSSLYSDQTVSSKNGIYINDPGVGTSVAIGTGVNGGNITLSNYITSTSSNINIKNLTSGRQFNLPDSSGTAALKEYTVNSISRIPGKDSIIFFIGTTRYAIKDSIGISSGGTVTSVSALTLGTSGTDLSSTVANSTTTPVITLNVPDASQTARGVVTTNSQTFAGTKSFSSDIKIKDNFGTNYDITIGLGSHDAGVSTYNTAMGYNALFSNTTGSSNVAMGFSSLALNTTGVSNSAFGAGALGRNTSGYYNSAFGTSAGSGITTGANNCFFGINAGGHITKGIKNIAIGSNSLGFNSLLTADSGSNNIAIGFQVLGDHESGDNNTILGNNSGAYITTGANNTFLGAQVNIGNVSNNVVIADGEANIRFKDDNTNTILPRLAGTGTRMVVAGTNGELSTQTIPSGGGGVTSIAQGYGITNSPNPIIATGTITVDTATLSGKYLRTTDGVPYTGATSSLNMGAKNISANSYFNGFTSMIAAGTTVVLTIDSTPVHLVTTGSGSQTYQLPNATTLTNGTIFSFNNNQSSGNINVNNNSGTLVKAVGSGGYMTLELLNNTTSAGTWDAHFQTPSNVSWSTNTFDYGGSITSAQWNGTTVAYNRGGTGQSSLFTQGGVAFGSTTTALGTTAAGTAGQMLVSAGTGTPTWADTSVFQHKSISSYTMLANNTNASGNATAQTFRDTAGTYTGTIAWNGTAPTTQTINKYQWQQTGKMVRLQLFGYYTNAGVGCSAVSLTLPSDCPAPDISMFTSGATAILYTGTGGLGLSNTSLTTTTNAYMRRNTGNTDNELYITAASANYRRYQIDITYRAQ